QINRSAFDFDAVLRERMFRGGKSLGTVEQRLGRDAADVQTRPAEKFAFDAGDFEAELSRADRRDVSARAGADDDDVKIALAHARADCSSLPMMSNARVMSSREMSRCVTARTRPEMLPVLTPC